MNCKSALRLPINNPSLHSTMLSTTTLDDNLIHEFPDQVWKFSLWLIHRGNLSCFKENLWSPASLNCYGIQTQPQKATFLFWHTLHSQKSLRDLFFFFTLFLLTWEHWTAAPYTTKVRCASRDIYFQAKVSSPLFLQGFIMENYQISA